MHRPPDQVEEQIEIDVLADPHLRPYLIGTMGRQARREENLVERGRDETMMVLDDEDLQARGIWRTLLYPISLVEVSLLCWNCQQAGNGDFLSEKKIT